MAKENQIKNQDEGKRRGLFKTLIDLAFIVFCSGLPAFYLLTGNLKELRLHEIVFPVLAFTGFGWILYAVLRFTLKRSSEKAAMLSGLAMVIATNAGLLTGPLGYAAALAISAVVTAGAFFVIIRFANGNVTEKIEYILSGVMAALILFNVAVSVPQFIENKRLSDQAAAKAASLENIEVPAEYAGGNAELPNMYIFVFDELAGSQCMKEVFGYDNTPFYNDMRELGFNVSGKSTNQRHFTYECLSGLFNFDYVFSYDEDGMFACQEQFWNARFFSLMQEMGYSLHEKDIAGSMDFEPHLKYDISKQFSETEDGYMTQEVIYRRSLFGPLVNALGIFPSDYEAYNGILDYYTVPENYKYKKAIMYNYICCPHAPFVYDLGGGRVDEDDRMKWTDSKYFLEQYEYICGRIEDTMKSIIENDPDSIIIVLSDHGVKQNKYLWNGPATTAQQSIDTFFAVYTGGRDDLGDITGLSGANVLRTVLNREYGFDLDMSGPPEE